MTESAPDYVRRDGSAISASDHIARLMHDQTLSRDALMRDADFGWADLQRQMHDGEVVLYDSNAGPLRTDEGCCHWLGFCRYGVGREQHNNWWPLRLWAWRLRNG